MRLVRLAVLVSLYVALDVTNPMMPGALVFAVEDSIEGQPWTRARVHDETPPAVAPAPPGCIAARRVTRAPAPARRRVWVAPASRALLALPSDSSSEDD